MPNNSSAKSHSHTANIESVLSSISVGAFFIIISVIFIINLPNNLWERLINFFSSFTLVQVPNTGLLWPAPGNPAAYTDIYSAAFQLTIAIGILNAIMLILRVWFNSPIDKKAETVGHMVFWFGTSYLITVYLTSSVNFPTWFIFWTWIIMIFGWSLIAQSFVFLAKRPPHKT